jgi:hypothetical protein
VQTYYTVHGRRIIRQGSLYVDCFVSDSHSETKPHLVSVGQARVDEDEGVLSYTIADINSYTTLINTSFTYDHRTLKIELPVRSAVLKQCTGGLVVRWVTTGEYPLLYVFAFLLLI